MAKDLAGVEEITRPAVQAWQRRLADRVLEAKTREVHHSALRGFLRWLAADDVIPSSVYLAIRNVKVSPSLPDPIPIEDFRKLKAYFEPVPPARDLARFRDRALFWFLYSSASRISAVLELNREDYRDRRARIIQKGGREHVLVTTASAEQAVRDYLAVRKDEHPALFINLRYGREAGRLTKAGANLIWQRVALKLHINRFHSHQLRHTGGTDLYAATGDILLVSRHLGHATVNTTAGYAKLATERRAEALEALEGNVIPLRPGYLKPISRRSGRQSRGQLPEAE